MKSVIPDIINGLPNIFYARKEEKQLSETDTKCYSKASNIAFNRVQSSFGIALHMHQPTIPAGGTDLRTAWLISNLQHMMNNQGIGDNHNAPVFMNCYSRMSDIIRSHVDRGGNPRVMLDYSGNLLWGLGQMEGGRILENLKLITCDPKYYQNVEWLGTMWSHAVVTSTPIPDVKLHMMSFRKHFSSIFGEEALRRVKGFSPPEMHLPIHPDVCYAYVKALNECGYEWVMVQEHTVENLDGTGIDRPHFPHKLVAKNSLGEVAEISVLIKTQGSDTKIVAQMQPYYEAKTIGRQKFCGKNVPPFVLQIGDGENGGVMMNEYPPMYDQVFGEIGTEGVVGMGGSEYIEFVKGMGISENDFIPIQPIAQHRLWEVMKIGSAHAADKAIEFVHERDNGFNLDKGSWTSDRSWVKDYKEVLDPMKELSVKFHQKYDRKKVNTKNQQYREALMYLFLSQTSCFRYWGEGVWTEYAKELCRRGLELV